MTDESLFFKQCTKINWDYLPRFKYNVFLCKEDNLMDMSYRIFHYSPKIFHLLDDSFLLWEEMINILSSKNLLSQEDYLAKRLKNKGFKDLENLTWRELNMDDYKKIQNDYLNKKIRFLTKNLESIGVKEEVITQIKVCRQILKKYRQKRQSFDWAKNAIILLGFYMNTKNIAFAMHQALDDVQNKKGFIFEDRKVLKDYELLLGEVFSAFNMRIKKNQEDLEKTRKYYEQRFKN